MPNKWEKELQIRGNRVEYSGKVLFLLYLSRTYSLGIFIYCILISKSWTIVPSRKSTLICPTEQDLDDIFEEREDIPARFPRARGRAPAAALSAAIDPGMRLKMVNVKTPYLAGLELEIMKSLFWIIKGIVRSASKNCCVGCSNLSWSSSWKWSVKKALCGKKYKSWQKKNSS